MGKIVQLLDQYTNETVNFEVIPNLPENVEIDNVIYAQRNGIFYKRIIENGIVKPEWWGAKGDAITDDTNSIQDAINFAQLSNLVLKLDSYFGYAVSSLLVSQPCNFIATKLIALSQNDTVITFENLYFNNVELSIVNQYVNSLTNSNGLVVNNSTNCNFNLHLFSNLKNAVIFAPNVNENFSFNNIKIGYFINNEKSITLNNSYQNTFHEGIFEITNHSLFQNEQPIYLFYGNSTFYGNLFLNSRFILNETSSPLVIYETNESNTIYNLIDLYNLTGVFAHTESDITNSLNLLYPYSIIYDPINFEMKLDI